MLLTQTRRGARAATLAFLCLSMLAGCLAQTQPEVELLPRPLTLVALPTLAPVTLVPGGLSPEPTPTHAQGSVQHHVPGVEIRVWAGSGRRGSVDGPGREAELADPIALVLDVQGRLYVAERASGRIRVVGLDAFVRTWVGSASGSGDGAPDPTSPLDRPAGLVLGEDGALLVVDASHRLISLRAGGTPTILAGTDAGYRDGPALEAALQFPAGLALGPDGTVYIADSGNHRLRVLGTDGQLRTLAGSGLPGFADGAAAEARFAGPSALCISSGGQLYVADAGALGSRALDGAGLRLVSPEGQVETVAGADVQGYVDGPASEARFGSPLLGLALDGAGNLYVSDPSNHVVRMVTPAGEVMTLAGDGTYGLVEGSGEEARLGLPAGMVWDGERALYVADYGQHVIWRIVLPE